MVAGLCYRLYPFCEFIHKHCASVILCQSFMQLFMFFLIHFISPEQEAAGKMRLWWLRMGSDGLDWLEKWLWWPQVLILTCQDRNGLKELAEIFPNVLMSSMVYVCVYNVQVYLVFEQYGN